MADWKIVAQMHDRLGESAMWHAGENAIYWVDWYGPVLHRLVLGVEKPRNWTIPGTSLLGSFVFVNDGRLLLAIENGLTFFDPRDGSLVPFGDPNGGREGVTYNDSKIDHQGRLWVGTFDLGEADPRGLLYCVQPDGTWTVGDSGIAVTNGPAFSPDGRIMYFSDTTGRRILAYDVHPSSPRLTRRRVFATFRDHEGMPDGLTVDAEGGIWCAQYGGGRITRFLPDGSVSRVLEVPCPMVTSCSFGGPDMTTLFVTTGWGPGVTSASEETGDGGALLAIDTEFRGLPEPSFAPDPTAHRA